MKVDRRMVELLPATAGGRSRWDEALYAFLVAKGSRSGSRRTVEGYSRAHTCGSGRSQTRPEDDRSALVRPARAYDGPTGVPPNRASRRWCSAPNPRGAGTPSAENAGCAHPIVVA